MLRLYRGGKSIEWNVTLGNTIDNPQVIDTSPSAVFEMTTDSNGRYTSNYNRSQVYPLKNEYVFVLKLKL